MKLIQFNQGFGSGSESSWIRINLSCWIHEGKNDPQKQTKSQEISGFEVLDVLFRGLKASPVAKASFSRGLEKSKLQFFTKKNLDLELDPDPQLGKNAESVSA